MKLLSLEQMRADTGPVTQVYQYSVLKNLIAFLAFAGLSAGCFWQGIQGGYYQHGWSVPALLFKYLGFILLLGSLLCLSYLKKARSEQNWLVKSYGNKLQIKFRSYLNAHFGKADPVVIELPMREIRWCRKTRQSIASPGSDADTTRISFHTYLDIKLRSVDLEALQRAIQAEHKREAPISERARLRRELFRARKNNDPAEKIDAINNKLSSNEIKSQKKRQAGMHRHYPVRLTDNGIVRLEWNGIYPRINQIMESLRTIVSIEPELKIKSTELTKLSGKQIEDHIMLLIQRGDAMQAVQLVRQKYDMSLQEAKQFVDELSI